MSLLRESKFCSFVLTFFPHVVTTGRYIKLSSMLSHLRPVWEGVEEEVFGQGGFEQVSGVFHVDTQENSYYAFSLWRSYRVSLLLRP